MDSSKTGRCSSFIKSCLQKRSSHTKVKVLNESCIAGHVDWCPEKSYGVCSLNCLRSCRPKSGASAKDVRSISSAGESSASGTLYDADKSQAYEDFQGKRVQVAWTGGALRKKPSRFRRIIQRLRRQVARIVRVHRRGAAVGSHGKDQASPHDQQRQHGALATPSCTRPTENHGKQESLLIEEINTPTPIPTPTPTLTVESVTPVTTPEASITNSEPEPVGKTPGDVVVEEERRLAHHKSRTCVEFWNEVTDVEVDAEVEVDTEGDIKLSRRKSHVTFWNEGREVEVEVGVTPVASSEDVVDKGQRHNSSGEDASGPQSGDQPPVLAMDQQVVSSVTSSREPDGVLSKVRSRGDADGCEDTLPNLRRSEAEMDNEVFKDQDNIVFSVDAEEEEERPRKFDDKDQGEALKAPKDEQDLARWLSDTPLPGHLPFDGDDDDEPKPSSIWYNPANKKQPDVKLYEDEDDNEDIFDVVNNLPRTEILNNLQTVISFCKITINKTENVLRRWKRFNLNPLVVPGKYDSREQYIDDLTLPLEIQTSLHLQESSRLFMQYDTIIDFLQDIENVQENVMLDIKSRYIRVKTAPTLAKELANHYNYFRNTPEGRTVNGRRKELKRLAEVMEAIREED